MDRLTPTLVIVAFLIVVFAIFALGWRARRRRQAGLPELATVPAQLGAALFSADGFYVATTVAEAPTDRVAVRGLGFRSRAGIAVVPEGVVLEIAGQREAFIPAASIIGVGRATWTIDRVVGRDGLVVVTWTLGDTAVDTYVKTDDPSALVDALTTLAPVKESA